MDNLDNKHQYHLYFALKEGELKHISEVENGLKCNCICPACEKTLIARNGGIKRVHHFAHYESAECKYGVQSAIHLAAKNVLGRIRKIKVPSVHVFCTTEIEKRDTEYISHGTFINISEERYIPIEAVITEKKLHKYIPDVVAISRGKKLIIEIAVTHFVGRKKLGKIMESNVSALEIDLSDLDNEFKLEDLETLIIENIEHKTWLYNRYANEQRVVKQRQLTNEINKKNKLAFRQEREHWYINHYKDVVVREIYSKNSVLHVDSCPLKKREFKGQFYANVRTDCFNCEYSRGLRENDKFLICLHQYYEKKRRRTELPGFQ